MKRLFAVVSIVMAFSFFQEAFAQEVKKQTMVIIGSIQFKSKKMSVEIYSNNKEVEKLEKSGEFSEDIQPLLDIVHKKRLEDWQVEFSNYAAIGGISRYYFLLTKDK